MYSTYNEPKLLLKDLLGRWKTRLLSISQSLQKKIFFDALDDIVNKYNNTVHRGIKLKPINIISDSYAEYHEDSNQKEPKFKVCDHVRISKYKNILLRDTSKTGQKKFLWLVKLKIQLRRHTQLPT